MTDWALEALDRLKDEAFFLAVGLVKPHLPFCAPKKYWDLYDPEKITLPENDYLPEDVPDEAFGMAILDALDISRSA